MRREISYKLILVPALLLALLLAGCGQVTTVQPSAGTGSGNGGNAANGPIKIAVVPKAVGFDYWEQVHKGATCAASKQKNVTMQWDGVTAETDVTGQVNLLTNFITQGVNGLVYAATDAKALTQVTNQALNAKIKVVNIDSGTEPQPANVPLFATDNQASAVKAADLLAQSLGGKGKIAFIPFLAGSATNDQRAAGFKQGLAKYPGLQLVAEQYSQSDANTALRVTQDILSAHPDITGIFAANEPGVIGAAQAVQRAGKAGKIVIIGWDAAPDEIKGVQDGVISALVVQNPFKMGYDGLNAAVQMVRIGAQVKSEDTGVTFVKKDNLNDPKVQAVLKPSCENPPL
ncbi:LacI family transcriptional regulator [Ktedonosporobacter rubrisoli]|uniref:LacI family transcriptional regulator n=1 Tax=Ktedonosporobacter rubrisoli TaxID=2509675 RepID=A0A4P6JMS5_KTERU|nr:ABC transporter substrate-binding protein [Ktedonosporobacter rubrisoli]QBD76370.1 LacI family transcriptional regulator [Ktedonosporobacter rubrisoli]